MPKSKIHFRKGRVQDFEKLNHEWAWSPDSEWQGLKRELKSFG